MPAGVSLDETVEVLLRYSLKGGETFEHKVKLSATRLPKRRAKLGICVSPLFGELDMLKVVEWRVHHARIGFETVHFYERNAGDFNLSSWIAIWNARLGTHDTLGIGAPISPSTWQTSSYMFNSSYADQVRTSRFLHLHLLCFRSPSFPAIASLSC